MTNDKNKKYIKIIKSKYFKGIIAIAVIVLGMKFYTGYLYENLNNETPREAIVEFIYGETHSWKSFFIEVEESENVYDRDEDSLYYHIQYNGWYSIPGDLGGTIELKKINDRYYVVKYLGYC